MHGVMGKPPTAATNNDIASSRIMLLMLVAMTGVAPISLYLLVPALPKLAVLFGRDISVAQMTVSLYMVGIACSQIIMGPLSDKFGRRPVLLWGLGLMVVASIGCMFAQNLPQLIAARVLLARDLLCHHRGIAHHRRDHRFRAAGDAARPPRGRRLSRRCRQPRHQP